MSSKKKEIIVLEGNTKMTKMIPLVSWIAKKKSNTDEMLMLWNMSMVISLRLQSVKVPGSSNENLMNWNPLELITHKHQENYHLQALFISSDDTVREIV